MAVAAIGALYFAVRAALTGELTFKSAFGGVAAIVMAGLLVSAWFDCYIIDPNGVRRRAYPVWLKSPESYVLKWDRPVYALIRDYGFLGKMLILTNHEVDEATVEVMKGTTSLKPLLDSVRQNREAFASGRFEVAEKFLLDATKGLV